MHGLLSLRADHPSRMLVAPSSSPPVTGHGAGLPCEDRLLVVPEAPASLSSMPTSSHAGSQVHGFLSLRADHSLRPLSASTSSSPATGRGAGLPCEDRLLAVPEAPARLSSMPTSSHVGPLSRMVSASSSSSQVAGHGAGLPCEDRLLAGSGEPAPMISMPTSSHVPVMDDRHFQFHSHASQLVTMPVISTWNARSLFCADTTLQSRKLAILGKLCAGSSIVCVQECHGSRLDWEGLLPHCVCLHSAHPVPLRGGVAFVVEKRYLMQKELTFEEVVLGRVAALTVVGGTGSLAVYTLRLEGESRDHKK